MPSAKECKRRYISKWLKMPESAHAEDSSHLMAQDHETAQTASQCKSQTINILDIPSPSLHGAEEVTVGSTFRGRAIIVQDVHVKTQIRLTTLMSRHHVTRMFHPLEKHETNACGWLQLLTWLCVTAYRMMQIYGRSVNRYTTFFKILYIYSQINRSLPTMGLKI